MTPLYDSIYSSTTSYYSHADDNLRIMYCVVHFSRNYPCLIAAHTHRDYEHEQQHNMC
jgi:hypothetical protein